MDYETAKREAQSRADETGMDYGVELLGKEHRYFGLPQRRNRFGFELRCEVVSCTDLAKCAPGHGPVIVPSRKRRVSVDGETVSLDGRKIGRVSRTSDGWEYVAHAAGRYALPARSFAGAILGCVHSYASWIGWHAVIVDHWPAR